MEDEKTKGVALNSERPFSLLVPVFIVSLSVLMFEITLIRVFSVTLAYHYVFVIVSLAVLGLGLGGGLIHRIKKKIAGERDIFKVLFFLSLLFPLSLIFSLILWLKASTTPTLALYSFTGIVPFFFAGMFLSLVFTGFTRQSSKIYFADLAGAATGSLMVILALQLWGGINTVLLAGGIASLSGLFLALASKRKILMGSTLIFSSFLFLFFYLNLNFKHIDVNFSVHISPEKTLFANLNDPDREERIIYTDWNAFARTDVTEGKDPYVKWIYIDGGAGSKMLKFDGDLHKLAPLIKETGFFPFYQGRKDKILIIGPGGGKDVLLALLGGAKEITAVEINPGSVKAVKKFSSFNGNIYDFSNVKIFLGDGRSFVKRSQERYNIIYLSLVYTQTASMVGYSLAENYIFTKEAFVDYLGHLDKDGRVVMLLHDSQDLLKVFATAISVLEDKGVSAERSLEHMIIINGSMAKEDPGRVHMPLFILKKSPFTMEEATAVLRTALVLKKRPLFIPYVYEEGLYSLIGTKMSLKEFISGSVINVKPAVDDSPFFYNFNKGVPPLLGTLLLISLFLAGTFLIPSYTRGRLKNSQTVPGIFHFLLYFTCLGLGFMLIEIALIQKFILFLGYPTLAFSVTLFSILLGGGLGSLTSNFIEKRLTRKISLAALGISAVIIAYLFGLPFLLDKFLSSSILARSLITMAIIFPLGFLMGVPFPTGLRILNDFFPQDIAWMWAVNAVMSVVGSILAVIMAILFGFTWALLAGAVAYIWIFYKFHSFDIIEAKERMVPAEVPMIRD
ncbi:MAG: hypothetical protein ACE5HR_08010 [bacterium]